MAEKSQLTLEKYPSYNTFLVNNGSSNNGSSFFTCDICVELVPLNAKFKNMEIMKEVCSHNYCTGCIAKYIQVKVIQDNMSQIKCPSTNCSAVLDTLSCRSIVSKNIFEKWCRAHCESAVLLDSSKGGLAYGRSYCPYRDCSELVLNECVKPSQSRKLTKSRCPSCKQHFCFHCMVPWKKKHLCVDRSETKIDNNDVLFIENVKHNKWVRFPSCNHYVERRGGCRIITCRCKTKFCYNCGKQACICKNELPVHWLTFILCVVLCLLLVLIGMTVCRLVKS